MYNRYIPQEEAAWVRADGERERWGPSGPERLPGGGALQGLLKSLRLDGLDAGDILLLLILLYLLAEGDDLEPVIALGLVLIMGLWEQE